MSHSGCFSADIVMMMNTNIFFTLVECNALGLSPTAPVKSESKVFLISKSSSFYFATNLSCFYYLIHYIPIYFKRFKGLVNLSNPEQT